MQKKNLNERKGNEKVVEKFLTGQDIRMPNASVRNGKLYSYDTVIAVLKDGTVYLNNDNYSATTSALQSEIRRGAVNYGFDLELVSHEDLEQEVQDKFMSPQYSKRIRGESRKS